MININDLPKTTMQLLDEKDVRGNEILENHIADKKLALKTKSTHHQFIDLKDRVIKRYIKTSIVALSFFRQYPDPKSRARLDGILQSDDPNYYMESEPKYTKGFVMEVVRMAPDAKVWRYDSEVIELYDGIDNVVKFELWNADALADGRLIEYDESIEYEYDMTTGMLTEASKVNDMASLVARLV